MSRFGSTWGHAWGDNYPEGGSTIINNDYIPITLSQFELTLIPNTKFKLNFSQINNNNNPWGEIMWGSGNWGNINVSLNNDIIEQPTIVSRKRNLSPPTIKIKK